MTCDEAIRAIEALIDHEVGDDERLHLEAHLAECEACRREVDERRAFSDRLRRDLGEAFPAPAAAAPRVVFRPRRIPWLRAAAVVLVGMGIGYLASAAMIFGVPSAEAREVANLSALKDAYESRDGELAAELERAASDLDLRVSRTPDGPRRDAAALCVMHAAAGLAGNESIDLPKEPEARAREVALMMSNGDLATRGRVLHALRGVTPLEVTHIEGQIKNLNGANRTFMELCVKAVQGSSQPAIVLEFNGGELKFMQLENGRVRLETTEGASPKIYDGLNILEFRANHPAIAQRFGLQGVDGNFKVGGVHQQASAVEFRPAAYVPAMVWSVPQSGSAGVVDALSVQAVMVDSARSGATVEHTEEVAKEFLARIRRVGNGGGAVTPDPERVRRYVAEWRKSDAAQLALVREQLRDEMAELERRVEEKRNRLEVLRKACVTLEYRSK